MGKLKDNLVKLECSECHNLNYYTQKNKKKLKVRLELKKYCKNCKKSTAHKETK